MSSPYVIIERVRSALGPLKKALDERDDWEKKVTAHELANVMPSARRVVGGRSVGSRGTGTSNALASSNAPRIPRQLLRQVYVRRFKTDPAVITTALAAATETNYSFNAAADPQSANYSALFDFFWILKVEVEVYNTQPPGGLGNLPRVYTAIDYNNTTNITSVAAIEDFESCREVTLAPGRKVTRVCKPTFLTTVGANATSAPMRGWINIQVNGTPWFGFRSIVAATPTATTILNVTHTYWVAFQEGT